MAVLGEGAPFGQYYGSIDSTALFVLLAGLYWRRTGDIESMRRLWPHVCAALEWIDRYGDLGLELDARSDKMRFLHPHLADFLDEVELNNLRLGSSKLDVCLRRQGKAVAVTVVAESGPASVKVVL